VRLPPELPLRVEILPGAGEWGLSPAGPGQEVAGVGLRGVPGGGMGSKWGCVGSQVGGWGLCGDAWGPG